MRTFPIMTDRGVTSRIEMPWEMIAPHEAEDFKNQLKQWEKSSNA